MTSMIRVENASTEAGRVRVPAGLVLKPPVRFEELAHDIHHDPEEAEALVALIRSLRREGLENVTG